MARSLKDILKGLWMTMLKQGDDSISDRINQARLTTTKLRAVTGQHPKLELPVAVAKNVDDNDERKITGELPAFSEFKEVLGIDPVVPQTATGTHRISHVSQYRLTAFFANLPENARKAALGTTGTHTLPST